MRPTEVIPTDSAVDALDSWCRARGLDTRALLDPPPDQTPARLWRQGDWLRWTVPVRGGGEVVVPAGRVGSP